MKRLALAGTAFVVAAIGVWGAGEVLSAPARSLVGPPPSALKARGVVLETVAGQSVAGWFAEGTPGRGVVLLLHGVRGDRRQMVDRAVSLRADGYGVLLVDLPAHGESSGDRITFGYREAVGVTASLRFLREHARGEPTAVVGVSLGAASFLLAQVEPPPNAVVLESMYPTIEEAVRDRLRLRAGSIGAMFAPLLLTQLPLRLGISAHQLRPIDHLPGLRAPLLVAAGTDDHHTTQAETLRIFETAQAPKELWLVEGAGHVDLYAFDPRGYKARVFEFLAKGLSAAG